MTVPISNTTHSSVIDRSAPPKPGRPSRVSFPKFTIQRLKNGIPVYIVERHTQPYVSLQLVLRSGSGNDGELPGLASFTSSLLLSGAGEMDARHLAEEIDYLGAVLDAGAGRDEITVRLGVLTKFLPKGLDLMADVVLRPTFPADEVTRERKQAIAALKQSQADPAYLAAVQLRREIHGSGPYGAEVDGTEETLRRIRREGCVAFHREHFTAGNAFFVAAGDVDPALFTAMLDERFGGWRGEAPDPTLFPASTAPQGNRVVVVDRPGSVQSAIRLGTLGIARKDPDYIPLVVVNTLFGGYFNSRINHNLREVHGYTYGARSSVDAPLRPGLMTVTASVRTDVTAAAVEEVFTELRSITTDPVGEEELEMVKNYVIGSQALQIETPGQVAGFVRSIALYDLPLDYYERFPESVRGLARETLLAVAQRRMNPDTMVIVVAGHADAIANDLERFGPVTVVDEKGKRVR